MDWCSLRLSHRREFRLFTAAGQQRATPVRCGGGKIRVGFMSKHPILDVPLSAVIRLDIALPLQHVLKLYTVGSLLKAWRNPRNQRSIEQVFDSPDQARNAVAVCATWIGVQTHAAHEPVPAWWRGDERTPIGLA